MTRCAICQQPVQVLPNDTRQGPEGLARCSDHAGDPLPPDVAEDLAQLEPTAGDDYYRARKRRYSISFNITIAATILCWEDGTASGHPVDPDEDPRDLSLGDLLNRDDTVIEDAHEVHTYPGQPFGDEIKLTEDGDPFDRDAWEAEEAADLTGAEPVPQDGDRPETGLEVYR